MLPSLLLMRTYEYIPEDLLKRTFIGVPRHFPALLILLQSPSSNLSTTTTSDTTWPSTPSNVYTVYLLHSLCFFLCTPRLPQGTINNFNTNLSIFRQVLLSVIENSHFNGRAGWEKGDCEGTDSGDVKEMREVTISSTSTVSLSVYNM